MKAGYNNTNTEFYQSMLRKIKIYLLVLLWSGSVLFAQGSISVESKVDKSTIFIGDVIQYSVILTHDPDVTVYLPELATNLGMFELRDYKVLDPQKVEDKIVSQTDYSLSTFDTGEFEIPELQIGYNTESDSTIRFIKTEPLTITVESLNPEEDSDIRDIKTTRVPPIDYKRYAILGSIIFLVLALLITAWYFYRRYRQGKSLLPVRQAPPRPAHEVALEALNALVAGDLLKEGKFKVYYIELSDIIRQYIQDRFYINAPEMTTSQLLDEMDKQQLEKQYHDMMNEFLNGCDLIKFAKYIPDDKETEIFTSLAFDFVEQTKMVIEELPKENDSESEMFKVDDEEQASEESLTKGPVAELESPDHKTGEEV